jgi:hypothetical protein
MAMTCDPEKNRTHPKALGGLSTLPLVSKFGSASVVRSGRRSGTGGGGRVARRCLMEGGLRSPGPLPGSTSSVARNGGELVGDGNPICGFCPRDGGGGGGRLRMEELWSGVDGSGEGARDSGCSSKYGVGEGRRLPDNRGPSNTPVSLARGDPLGNFAGDSLAFCSNKFLRSFTAGVALASMSCERGDMRERGTGDW